MAEAHRINRLSLRVRSSERDEAFRLRRDLRQAWPAVLPALESGFDSIAGADRWVHLDRLQLDLGVAQAESLQSELAARIQESLRKELQRYFLPDGSPAMANGALPEHPMDEPLAATGSPPDAVGPVQALEQYLLTGRLPWYQPPGTDWTDRARAIAREHWRRLAAICTRQPAIHPWLRWLDLVDGVGLSFVEVIAVAAPDDYVSIPKDALATLLRVLLDPQGPVSSRHRRHRLAAMALILVGYGGRAGAGRPDLAIPTESRLSAAEWDAVARRLGGAAAARSFVEDFCSPLRRQAAGSGYRVAHSNPVDHGEPTEFLVAASADVPTYVADAGERPAVRVAYAGSVLLHPYLPRLFDACGIGVADGSILQSDHERAAALLCFAANGADRDAEFNLEFFKLLLGLSRDRPLSIAGDLLKDNERAEVNAMLAAFIEHWRALRGTSIAGLRSAFLQRAGSLKPVEDGYSLTIERTGIDVLLDRIPFSCSLVKLPWMPRPIHVEW